MEKITFETKEFSGYKYETFTMVIDGKVKDVVDLINDYKEECEEEITLNEIEELLTENNIRYEWVNAENVIRL